MTDRRLRNWRSGREFQVEEKATFSSDYSLKHGVLVPSLFHHIATAAGSGGSLLFIVAVFRLSPVLRCILLPSLGQTYVLDTVQYSTVQYTEYSTIALVSNVCSGWPSPCWSCPAPPSRRTRCPTHTRTRAPPPSPAPRGDTCRATWSVASPGLASDHDPYYYNETYCNAPCHYNNRQK